MWPVAQRTAALASCGGNPELLAGKEEAVGVQMAGEGVGLPEAQAKWDPHPSFPSTGTLFQRN